MANKELRVNVVVNTKTKELDKMFKRLNRMQAQVNRQAVAQNSVTAAVNRTNKAYKKSTSLVNGLTKAVRHLAGGYILLQAAKAGVTASDSITSAENKLNHLNATALGSAGYTTDASGAEVYSQATLNATQQSMDKMYTSAQKVRVAYVDMMKNVSKSMTLAGDAFGGNIDNAIRFQEIMGEAYALSGASQQEMSSSMYQMIQGLGSGILQGDELRSVREGAPMAYQAIEEYAQGILKTDESLKDLAADGKITSDLVVAAILQNGEKMDKAFAKTEMTFAQAWTTIKNTALKSFEPVLQKMNDLLNSDVGQAMIDGINTAIQIVAKAFLWLFAIIEGLYTFIADNWGIVKNVLLALAAILGTVLLVKIGQLIQSFTRLLKIAGASAATWLGAWWPLVLIIGVLIWMIIKWAKSTQTACDFIYEVLMGLVWGIIGFLAFILVASLATGTLILGIPMLIGLAVIALLAILLAAFIKYTGEIIGGVLGSWEVIKAVISWISTGWQNMCNNLKGWFWNSIADMLESIDWLLKGVNKIREALGKDAVDIGAIRAKAETFESKVVENKLDINAAWEKGYTKGYGIGTDIQDKINGFGEKLKGAVNGDGLEELLGLTALPNTPLDVTGINSDLGGIKDNTGKMADSMELTEEDLAYLRNLAHMEWKKEFTTANITVDMSNYNTINGENDLDGIVTKLADKLYEEMNVVANGVYA